MSKDRLAATIIFLDAELKTRARELENVTKTPGLPEGICRLVRNFAAELREYCAYEEDEIKTSAVDVKSYVNDLLIYLHWNNHLFAFHAQMSELEEEGLLTSDDEEDKLDLESFLEDELESMLGHILEMTEKWVNTCLELARTLDDEETGDLASVSAAPLKALSPAVKSQPAPKMRPESIPLDSSDMPFEPDTEWLKHFNGMLAGLEKAETALNTFTNLSAGLAPVIDAAIRQISELQKATKTGAFSQRIRPLTIAQGDALRIIRQTFNYALYEFLTNFPALLTKNNDGIAESLTKKGTEQINKLVVAAGEMIFSCTASAFATHIPPGQHKAN